MNRAFKIAIVFLALWQAAGIAAAATDVDWQVLLETHLDAVPLDSAISADGELVFVLGPKSIRVHDAISGQLMREIPLEAEYDRIHISSGDRLVLSGSKSQQLKVLDVERIFPIEIGDHPIIGPADAPVTIAVFDDYQ
jgi:hypothetical protein